MNRIYLRTQLIFVIILCSIIIALIISGCSNSQRTIETGSVNDIDGNVYKTVKIGKQWWMAENLKVTKYTTGEAIPNITDGDDWCKLTTGAYCVYDNDSSNIPTFGLLYNWYAAIDSRGICPEGWHVPSDGEILELEKYLGMKSDELESFGARGSDEGGKLKEAGTVHWQGPNIGATDELGFSVVPSGGRQGNPSYHGRFENQGKATSIWSSTEYSDTEGLYRRFLYDESRITRYSYSKGMGFTIRCVMD